MSNLKIEADEDTQTYRLIAGEEDKPGYVEGLLVDFGEPAFISVGKEVWHAYIDFDGQTDGNVYAHSSGEGVQLDNECDFSDAEEESEEEAEEAGA